MKTGTLEVHDQQMAALLVVLEGQAFIAGGAARWLIAQHLQWTTFLDVPPPTDIDLFLHRANEHGNVLDYLTNRGYEEAVVTDWCTEFYHMSEPLPVQVVGPCSDIQQTSGTPEEVIGKFDFTVNQAAVWFNESGFHYVHSYGLYDAIERRRLIINNVCDPVDMLRRVAKYGKKGFGISRFESAKILDRWAELQDNEREQFRNMSEGRTS